MTVSPPIPDQVTSGTRPAAHPVLISVNVGLPAVLGYRRGRPVVSGIRKRPVTMDRLVLDRLNLEGDGQADLRAHGGVDKAVFAYPAEHLAAWSEEFGMDPPFAPGSFGENLTVAGLREDQVCIGDIWEWGEARLQVAQPRWPCFKLAMATGVRAIVARFIETGRCGWYLRVLQPGQVPIPANGAGTDLIRVIERHPAGVTVLDAQRAFLDGATRDQIERVLAVEALAPAWRKMLLSQLEKYTEQDCNGAPDA